MKITRTSIFSGKTDTLEIDVTPEQLAAYDDGALLQDAFPNISPPLREFIKSGVTPEEWLEFINFNAEIDEGDHP